MPATTRNSNRGDRIARACRLFDRAHASYTRGRLAAAEKTGRQSLELLEKAQGAYHPDVSNVLNTLAAIVQARGAYDEAEALARRSVEIMDGVPEDKELEIEQIRAQALGRLAGICR